MRRPGREAHDDRERIAARVTYRSESALTDKLGGAVELGDGWHGEVETTTPERKR